jgi:hypothetical protein
VKGWGCGEELGLLLRTVVFVVKGCCGECRARVVVVKGWGCCGEGLGLLW